jgi:hypothetical protein
VAAAVVGALPRDRHPPAAVRPARRSSTRKATAVLQHRRLEEPEQAHTAPQIGGRGDLPTAVRDVHVHIRSGKPNAIGGLPQCSGSQLQAMEVHTKIERARP